MTARYPQAHGFYSEIQENIDLQCFYITITVLQSFYKFFLLTDTCISLNIAWNFEI